jgi:hypothetical protein
MFTSLSKRTTFLAVLLGLLPGAASSQVVFSTGVQEFYDSNVFLEDDLSEPREHTSSSGGVVINKYNDGNLNDDYITSVYVRGSTAPHLSRYFTSAFDVQVGGLFFANEGSENRLTLDSVIRFENEQNVLPQPWLIFVESRFDSSGMSLASASGTAARQGETHDATMGIQVGERQLTDLTYFNAGYSLLRHDFLGEWTSDSSSDNRSPIELQGSDYFDNRIDLSLKRIVTEKVAVSLLSPVSYLTFTDTDSNSVDQSSDLDRVDYTPALGVSYLANRRLSLGARVGVDYSYFTQSPADRTITVIGDDGLPVIVTETPSRDETSLFYSGDLSYLIGEYTSVQLSALQSAGTDIDGQRVLVRSFGINGSHMFGNRTVFTIGGLYSQFDEGDSLSGATERYEAVTSLRFSLTDTLAIQLGYNYANQNAGDQSGLSFGDNDYETHRIFLSLDTGFVGLPG